MKKVYIVVISIMLGLLVACFVFGFTVKKESLKYPDFTKGYTTSDIYKFAINNGIKLSVKTNYMDNGIEAGTIVFQDKEAGSVVSENDELYIIVSGGKRPVATPSIPTYEPEEEEYYEEEDEESEENKKLRKKLELTEDDYILEPSSKYYSIVKNLDEDGRNTEAMLVDKKTYKILLSEKSSVEETTHSAAYVFEGGFILVEQRCMGSCSDYYSKLYSKDLKLIVSDFKTILIEKNVAIVLSDNTITKYDTSGNVLSTETSDDEILEIFKDYKIIQRDKTIMVKTSEEEYKVLELKDKMKYRYSIMGSKDIYIIIVDESITVKDYMKYDKSRTKGDYDKTKEDFEYSIFGYEYAFNLKTKKVTKEMEEFPKY